MEAGQALAQRIREEMQSIRQEIEPQLPTRQLNKTEAKEYCFPAKPWKADGSWSHHMQRFAERHGLKQVEGGVEYEGKVVPIVAGSQLPKEVPITLDDESTPLKDYFLSQGWEPTFFNQKKDEKGFKVTIRDACKSCICVVNFSSCSLRLFTSKLVHHPAFRAVSVLRVFFSPLRVFLTPHCALLATYRLPFSKRS